MVLHMDWKKVTCLLYILATCVSLTLGTAIPAPMADYLRSECTLDDDGTNAELEHCKQLGEEFAENYDRFFKKGKEVDKCSEFRAYESCLGKLLNACPNLRDRQHLRRWLIVHDTMKEVCTPGQSEWSHAVTCLEEEHSTIFMSLCQELYDFNIAQNTHSKCRFLREKLDCEASLVGTSCGEPVADFYTALMRIHPKRYKCYTPVAENEYRPPVFKYTAECPRNLTEKLQECSKLHPLDSILHFREENDLIAEDNRKHLKASCSSYLEYSSCFDDIRRSCPDGVQRILDFNANLRSYMLKMDFICNGAKRAYLESMYCYQEVLANNTFSSCDHVWGRLIDKLLNITSYEYYCRTDLRKTIDVRRSLKEIEKCYERVLTTRCGEEAGVTMAELIEKAFEDPYYLQYAFKPDCMLHGGEAATIETNTQHGDTIPSEHGGGGSITQTTITVKPSPFSSSSTSPPVQGPTERGSPQQGLFNTPSSHKPIRKPVTHKPVKTGELHGRGTALTYSITLLVLVTVYCLVAMLS